MTKAITYSSFIIACILVALAFVTAKSYTQLAIGVILYPALAYYALKVFPRKSEDNYIQPSVTVQLPSRLVQRAQEENRERVDVVDVDKRTFLKLVGTVGLSFFVFSLLGRKVGDMLFGRSLSSGVNPPQDTGSGIEGQAGAGITAGYKVSEIDEDIVSYYGFTNQEGGWLIMKEDTEVNSFRYAKGASGFPTNWDNRKKLKYDYFYNLF